MGSSVRKLRDHLMLFLKGVGMGAANVIPGVSGGTIAFITNIYEELIKSLKSLDLKAIKLAFKFRWKELSEHINLAFLVVLFAGVGISLISLGRLLKYLFTNFPIYVWAYFFGLILASVYFVGKKINNWQTIVMFMLVIGTALAIMISLFSPATQNENFIYLILCGVVAMSSMLLPGLSGSFVLILMGNYELIFLQAVPEMDLGILIPVGIGVVAGFVILSRIIAFVLERFRDGTIALLTGFILGSLLIIWPWKNEIYLTDQVGNYVLKNGQRVVESYDRYLPNLTSLDNILALGFIAFGFICVWFIESIGEKKIS
jgi:putative membrane protein